jgi:integrase/recombinase XerC
MIEGNNKKSKAGVNYLTEKEEKTLFGFLKTRKDVQGERDYVLLKLCRATALRRGEALSLNVGDIINKDKIIVNERICEKGSLGEIYLPLEIQELLKRFLRLKRNWGESLEDDSPLFISRKKQRLSPRSFNDLMNKWCQLAGIKQRFGPHSLRHTKMRRIIDDCKYLSDEEKQKALLFANKQARHKSLNSTMVYLQPTKEEMMKVAEI